MTHTRLDCTSNRNTDLFAVCKRLRLTLQIFTFRQSKTPELLHPLAFFGRRDADGCRCARADALNQASASSGRSGAWNRVRDVSALASGPLLLAWNLLAVGCNFTDFSKTKPVATPDAGPVPEPACRVPSELSSPAITPVAYWTFNNDAHDGGQWVDDDRTHTLVPGTDALADAGPVLVDYPRINGEGQSLNLDGHQFLRSAEAAGDDLVPDEFTIAAWISVPARAFTSEGVPFAWPILSTLGDSEHCDGYQLEIRFQGAPANPELLLSYQTPQRGDAGPSECRVVSLRAPVEVPASATGIGRWHHVAGTLAQFGHDRFQLALYWDGKRVQLQDPLEPLLEASSQLQAGERWFFVGASAVNAASAAQTKFTGFIDDVAIIDRPLAEQELHDFVLATTTRPGPSNCRWRASEQWDNTASDPTFAAWAPSSTPEALSVTIDDRDWGAGALDARIEPPLDVQLYDRAYIEADFPKGQGFQFTLASGDDYCTWTYLGRGSDRYEIDLTKPVSCVSTSCEVDLHRVDRASVTSEWAIPSQAAPDRSTGLETFVVRRLDFVPASAELLDPFSYGGVHGLRGYCWRLQAYEPETSAWWTQANTSWNESISATLKGPNVSGTRVMADFGDRGVDISTCATSTITATLESTGSATIVYVLAMQDIYGSWRSYDLVREVTPGSGEYNVSIFVDKFSTSATDPNFARFPQEMDLRRIRLIGLQKPWGYDGSLDVTIRDLRFLPEGCERPGPG